VVAVNGRIHRRELIAERRLIAIFLDQLGNVVILAAFERNRIAGHRPGRRHAGGKVLRIVVDRERFLVSGDHDDALMWLTHHWTLISQVVKVGVGVINEPVAPKEIVLVEFLVHLGHHSVLHPSPIKMGYAECGELIGGCVGFNVLFDVLPQCGPPS
jgi:hypothetical protein